MKQACAKCGADDRNKRGECRPCKNEAARVWKKVHKDSVRQTRLAWRRNNPDKVRAAKKRNAIANPETAKQRNRRRSANRHKKYPQERLAAKQRDRDELRPWVVCQILGLPASVVPPELVEVKRLHLRIKRKIQEMKHEIT